MSAVPQDLKLVSRHTKRIAPSGRSVSVWYAKDEAGNFTPFAATADTEKLYSGAKIRAEFSDVSITLAEPLIGEKTARTMPIVTSLTDDQAGMVWKFPPYSEFDDAVVKAGEQAIDAITSGKKTLTRDERKQAAVNLANYLETLSDKNFVAAYDGHNLKAVPAQVDYRHVEFLDSQGFVEQVDKEKAHLLCISETGKQVMAYLAANYGSNKRHVGPKPVPKVA